ncbi:MULTISPECIES: hypothetical protein [Shewanella]|uniref:hypothetical protein n=1 Tax=Shewanella TaxID=22 RepID=UPI001565F742|nr:MULTISPECIES: hypothetical protein [unclassified Shewanella]MBP7662547.1 hypothetical protein [Shewanella sp.]MCU8051470.1 hypothetical protein [Shewanella sp. SM43]MCU8078407.1 hypothetical protein [Shewanella sp. SM103]MCU8103446.1 hypothetical protein [Shewanella sp. SM101]NRD33856.1 hypothetical protein [Shewanella sp. DC2-4]
MHTATADSFQSLENKVNLLIDCLEGKRVELGKSSHLAWYEHLNGILVDVQLLKSHYNS